MFDVDPTRVRELADQVRERSITVAGMAPMAAPAREQARSEAAGSLALTRAEETLKTLDGVLKFHASRLTGLADMLDRAATEFEEQDRLRAAQFNQIGPR